MDKRDSLLVIDDEPYLLKTLCEYLDTAGYAVSFATSCKQAVEAFRLGPPDAVVVDYLLPDGNALELMERFRAVDPLVPCIVLTGHASIDLAVKAIKSGAEQFICKPVELSALRVVVERAVDAHRALLAVGTRGRATPIMQSRVTIAASSASDQPSVPAGRSGSTM